MVSGTLWHESQRFFARILETRSFIIRAAVSHLLDAMYLSNAMTTISCDSVAISATMSVCLITGLDIIFLISELSIVIEWDSRSNVFAVVVGIRNVLLGRPRL